MKEGKKVKIYTGLAILLSLCIVASTVISVCSLTAIGSLKNEVAVITGNVGDDDQENDITIMSEYTIESTKNISDAYKKNSDAGLSDKEKETLKLASDVLDEIITEGMSDYEKEKAIYDWLVKNVGQDKGLLTVIPSSGEDSDNPYGVLKYHDAVCVGYATTFRLFMEMMDIQCMVVHNTERVHTWDLVKLGDNWYHTDVYSDAESGNYARFNLNDSMLSQEQQWNRDFFPAAKGLEYNYSFMNQGIAKDIFDIPAVFKKKLDEEVYTFVIGFEKQPVNEDAEIVNTIMNSIQERLLVDYPESYVNWNWQQDKDGKYVLMEQIYLGTDDNTQITPEDAEKIGKKIAKAFGDKDIWPVYTGEIGFEM